MRSVFHTLQLNLEVHPMIALELASDYDDFIGTQTMLNISRVMASYPDTMEMIDMTDSGWCPGVR
jgi:hypothetical protein